MEKNSILDNTGEWEYFLLTILDLFSHLAPWKFSLAVHPKRRRKCNNTSSQGNQYQAVPWHTFMSGKSLTDDDLNSLKPRALVTRAHFNMISATITAASMLPLPSPFPFYNLKFPATAAKPCSGLGKLFPAGRSCYSARQALGFPPTRICQLPVPSPFSVVPSPSPKYFSSPVSLVHYCPLPFLGCHPVNLMQ